VASVWMNMTESPLSRNFGIVLKIDVHTDDCNIVCAGKFYGAG
jgi:hypothetical protein